MEQMMRARTLFIHLCMMPCLLNELIGNLLSLLKCSGENAVIGVRRAGFWSRLCDGSM